MFAEYQELSGSFSVVMLVSDRGNNSQQGIVMVFLTRLKFCGFFARLNTHIVRQDFELYSSVDLLTKLTSQ